MEQAALISLQMAPSCGQVVWITLSAAGILEKWAELHEKEGREEVAESREHCKALCHLFCNAVIIVCRVGSYINMTSTLKYSLLVTAHLENGLQLG